jgi:ATP-dependent helicase/nuclease subunit A
MSLTVYKSSAGSGKTYTLVLEYLCLVISNPESYKNILAITFTNKAANEMKGRIITALSEIVYPQIEQGRKSDELIVKIAQKTSLDQSDVKVRSAKALSNILHGYSNFAVSTIDSFVYRLVQNFARELRLPVNFDIELDQDKLIAKAMDLVMDKVGADEFITGLLVRFIAEKMNDEKSWNIENELREFAKNLLKESSITALSKLRHISAENFPAIRQAIGELINSIKSELMQPAQQAMQIMVTSGIEAVHLFQSTKGIYGYFMRISNGDFDSYEPNSYVKKLLGDQKWTSGKCPANMETIIQQQKPQLSELLQKQIALMEDRIKTYFLLELINENIYSTALLNEFETVMEEFRNNENIVHISEFNKRIAEILQSNPIPFIYERIGEKYHHLLIDEFQDTSLLQWQNLLPLIENSLAANNFNMIVGDGKQAIYRWRSGEVEQFAALPVVFGVGNDEIRRQRQQLIKNHYSEKNLNENFRSAKEIVQFNNGFFDFASQQIHDDLKKIYVGQKQNFSEKKTGGRVQIEFVSKEDLNGDELLNVELERIHQIVNDQSSEFNLSEIAILTRTNSDAEKVARYLLETGMNVVTADALQLSASSDVNFIINILRHINQPGQSAVAAGIIVYLADKIQSGLQQLHTLFESVSEIRQDNPIATPLEKVIREKFDFHFTGYDLRPLPIYEMADRIIKIFNLDANGQNPFVTFFRDMILKFTSRNTENLSEFLNYWEESGYKSSVIIPEKAKAVRVMTIHKAKGLQFPVVIYPFAKHQPKIAIEDIWIEPALESIPSLETAWVRNNKKLGATNFGYLYEKEVQKSFLDSLNVLYVAMTRPSERLFVILHDKHNQKGEWTSSGLYPDNADLFSSYFQNLGLWNKNQKIFCFGSDKPRKNHKLKKEENELQKESYLLIDGCISNNNYKAVFDFRDHISVRFTSPESREEKSAEKERQKGIIIHDIMAAIRTGKDVPIAIHQAVINGFIRKDESKKYGEYFNKVISNPELNFLFDEKMKIYTEKEILLKDNHILRVDRIVAGLETTWLADYKTGAPEKKHRRQLDDYALALENAGFKNISKYLIYLDTENFGDIIYEKWN